jgi:hypothetical protein
MGRMKRKIIPIALTAATLGLVFDFLFYGHTPGISVLLYTVLILLATFGLAERFNHTLPRHALALMPVALFFAGLVAIRANELLTFWNMLITVYILLLVALFIFRPSLKITHLNVPSYLSEPPRLFLRLLAESISEIRNTLVEFSAHRNKSSYAPYIRGAVISLPILLILTLLLSSADLVFQRFFISLFDFRFNGEIALRLILILLVATVFIGAFTVVYMRTSNETLARNSYNKFLGITEAAILLGSISVLFMAFIGVQIRYLFGGSEQVIGAGLTYAQYARKGFFELIAVAMITMATIWGVTLLAERRTKQQENLFLWIFGVIIAEVLVIMISAHMRLSLYENAYGFTFLRLFSHVFIALLAVTFISLFVHVWRREPEHYFAFRTFASVLVFFAVFNIMNPDALIARQNIKRFENTGKIDPYYLTRLSADATPAIRTLLTRNDAESRRVIGLGLHHQDQELRCRSSWQSFSLAKFQAQKTINQYKDELRAIQPDRVCFDQNAKD